MGNGRKKWSASQEEMPCVSVRVESGPGVGESYTFRKPCITIGRGPENDVTLASDGAVSNQHAKISWCAGRWEIEDCGSKNGTYLTAGSERIRLTGPHRLDTTQSYLLGLTLMRFAEGVPREKPRPSAQEDMGRDPDKNAVVQAPSLLRIELYDGRLVFQLYDQGACLAERSTPYDPEDAKAVSQRLAALCRRATTLNPAEGTVIGEQIIGELNMLGQHISQHYFPKRLYHEIAARAGHSMVLTHKLPLLGIPWEIASVEGQCFSLGTRLSRQLVVPDLTQSVGRDPVSRPCRLLFVVTPTGGLHQAQRSAEVLFERVRRARPEATAALVAGDRVNRVDLLRRLERADFVYFVGHSEHDPASPNDGGWPLAEGRISCADFRRMRMPPRFVFANGCETCLEDLPSGPRMSGGVASSMVLPGVRGYIGSRWPIPEKAGARFADAFFRHLLEGVSAGEALRRSRRDEARGFGLQSMVWASYVHIGFPDDDILSRTPGPGRSYA